MSATAFGIASQPAGSDPSHSEPDRNERGNHRRPKVYGREDDCPGGDEANDE